MCYVRSSIKNFIPRLEKFETHQDMIVHGNHQVGVVGLYKGIKKDDLTRDPSSLRLCPWLVNLTKNF